MLRRLGAVQLDTISVLARSHELVAYAQARRDPAGQDRARVLASAAACRVRVLVPCRLRAAVRRVAVLRVPAAGVPRQRACAGIRATRRSATRCWPGCRSEGPLTATQLGGAKNGGAWWDWSDTKIAVEWLLDTGEVICAERTGWRRVYDLPERVLPAELLRRLRPTRDCADPPGRAWRHEALGVVTTADLSRLSAGTAQRRIRLPPTARFDGGGRAQAAGLIPVADRGRPSPARRCPPGPIRPRWQPDRHAAARPRPRQAPGHAALPVRLADLGPEAHQANRSDFEHSLEAYVPKAKRVHGYFTMPLLAGGQAWWAGSTRPASGTTLIARQLTMDTVGSRRADGTRAHRGGVLGRLRQCRLRRSSPPHLEPRLSSALSELGA